MTRQAVGEISMPIHWRFKFLRRDERRAATAESIQHNVVFVAAGFDNAFKKFERLLCWIAKPFSARWH